MAEIIWTTEALNDTEEIAVSLARDSEQAASLFTRMVRDATEQLCLFPASGRRIQEAGYRALRGIVFGSYRLIYAFESEQVRIISIRHASRRLRNVRWRLDF